MTPRKTMPGCNERDLAGLEATVSPLRELYAALDRRPIAQPRTAPVPVLDEKTRNALRALGYLR